MTRGRRAPARDQAPKKVDQLESSSQINSISRREQLEIHVLSISWISFVDNICYIRIGVHEALHQLLSGLDQNTMNTGMRLHKKM